jgi:hypothetical protein
LKGDLSIGKLVAVATGGVGYYFIGISSKGVVRDEDASAHALAIDMFATKFANINKEGKYAFFDPNFGQAEFSDVQALKSCFITHFRLEYPTLHGHASIERYLGR